MLDNNFVGIAPSGCKTEEMGTTGRDNACHPVLNAEIWEVLYNKLPCSPTHSSQLPFLCCRGHPKASRQQSKI